MWLTGDHAEFTDEGHRVDGGHAQLLLQNRQLARNKDAHLLALAAPFGQMLRWRTRSGHTLTKDQPQVRRRQTVEQRNLLQDIGQFPRIGLRHRFLTLARVASHGAACAWSGGISSSTYPAVHTSPTTASRAVLPRCRSRRSPDHRWKTSPNGTGSSPSLPPGRRRHPYRHDRPCK